MFKVHVSNNGIKENLLYRAHFFTPFNYAILPCYFLIAFIRVLLIVATQETVVRIIHKDFKRYSIVLLISYS